MINLILKKSKIQGLGVFAGKDFKRNEIVIKWDTSNQLTKKQFDALDEKGRKYIANVDGKFIVQQAPAKYVNHSCNPNTYVRNFCDVAKRDIKKGEEITSDYGEDTEGFTMKCNCGSKDCRKIIKN